MREAKRRATQFSIPPTNREIEQAWKAMRTEGDGVYMLTVLSPVQVFEMLSRAQRGDRVALTILETIEHVLESVGRNPPDTPLCLLCGAEFDQLPELFGFVSAHRDDPTHVVASAICAECSAKHPTAAAMRCAVTDYLRAHLISDLRVLPQLSEAGHA